MSGNLSLSDEFYHANGIDARRPDNTSRAIFRTTISIYDQIQLPFEVYLSSDDRGYRQPFNQFGVSPRISDWLTLHAGYYSARLSDMSFGDTRLLGGGVDLHPGNFRFMALYGRATRAVEPDSARGVNGQFKRTIWAGKLGYGNEQKGYVDLNILHAIDDTTSLTTAPAGVQPQENAVATLAFAAPLFGRVLTVQGEVGLSAFTADIRAEGYKDSPGLVRSVFTPKISSSADGAAKLSLQVVPMPALSVRLNTQWVGPGYTTLGYAQLPNDVFDITIAPTVRLLNNALTFRFSIGTRQNNLRNNRSATTHRTIGSADVSYQPSGAFGLDVQYANNGMRSAPQNDTLRIQNISQSVTISPRYTFLALGGTDMLSTSFGYQDFTDKNVVTSAQNSSRTHSASVVWSLSYPSTLSLATSGFWNRSTSGPLRVEMWNVGETAGYQFFGRTVAASISLRYGRLHSISSDGQVGSTVSISYSPAGWGTFGFVLSTNSYDPGNIAAQPKYDELNGSLNYSIGF